MVDVDSVNTPQISANLRDLFKSPRSQLAVLTNNVTENSPFNDADFSMDSSANLKHITIPVLQLWGRYDPISVEDFKMWVGSFQVDEMIFLGSEAPMVTEPMVFADAVLRFLEN